ncbi:hypothetical protein AMTRI_Chr06g171530 [Amborella trichopoda]
MSTLAIASSVLSLTFRPKPIAAAVLNSPHFPNAKNTPYSLSAYLSSFAIFLSLSFPLPSSAIPSLNSQSPSLLPSTPFSQSQFLQIGLENGKIRPCPSTNPGCISTNPKSSQFAFPWVIPETDSGNAIRVRWQYLQAEVDGGFGRDVLEFLVKGDVVAYRSMATKVTYVYPFTTAFGDSRGQQERMKRIMDYLGWYMPSFESMD